MSRLNRISVKRVSARCLDPRALRRLSWRTLVREGHLSVNAVQWESAWSSPNYAPIWLSDSIPGEIKEAAEDWFAPGAKLLDIGCGDGRIAAWLSTRGYDVTGIDVAPSAIRAARERHRGAGCVRFEVADVTRPLQQRGFDALLDRGCFHLLRKKDKVAYVTHVAAAANPGAHLLLLHVISCGESPQDVIDEVTELCGACFTVEQTADVVMARAAEDERRGVAFRMVKP